MKSRNKIKNIWDYFEDHIEYPKDVADAPIPYGTVWSYISSTFLNGFINYVNPIGCYVVSRYTPDGEDITDRDVSVCDKGQFRNWKKFTGTKKELINGLVSEQLEMYHTRIDCFGDDVIILAKIESEDEVQNKYMFFWFDMDVSDCSVGRFITNDSEEEILKSIEVWMQETYFDDKRHEGQHEPDAPGFYKLPLSFLKGWLRF